MVADLARPGGLFGTAVHAEKAGDIIKKGHGFTFVGVKLRPNEHVEAFRWRLLKPHLQRHRDKQCR